MVEEKNQWRTISSPSPGFIIYTAKHFAVVREAQDIQRPDLADADKASAKEILAAWGPFAALFGSYELKGNVLSTTILVAKNKSRMGVKELHHINLNGDLLTTEPLREDGRPLAKPITLKLKRVE